IALIADVHYGISVDKAELDRICAEISAASPSIVVLCGDIVDENTSKQGMAEVFDSLGGIKTEFGVYYVFGNHDRQLYA
ncbi:MAG: metallophosphoesterase family protein, partial [Clostridia bacterium]|nr:metallophosphoesterase family protein [Clostridia bacterium]